jgi:polysaccharide pyruvyl transferase WcaK-like protein
LVALLSPSGLGNLGDRAILDSLIHGLRRRLTDPRIIAFTLNPRATSLEHAIEADTLLGYSLQYFLNIDSGGPDQPSQQPLAQRARPTLMSRLRKLPFHGAARSLLAGPLRVRRELRHLRRSLTRIRGAAFVLVAGGGQLDDFYGGAAGQPYSLLRWGLLAKAAGAKYLMLSVGTGKLSAASRFLVKRSLELASYRSFRDGVSRDLLAPLRKAHDGPVVPDLAYARPVQTVTRPPGGVPTVGISPMGYQHPRNWPTENSQLYQNHITQFGTLAAELLRRGHEVVLFTTDSEPQAIEDATRVIRRLCPGDNPRLRIPEIDSVDALLRAVGGCDLIVAARLHGVLLSHLAHRPVLAVAHERKVRTLMEELGHQRFCSSIDEFTAEEGLLRLAQMDAAREALSSEVRAFVERARDRVNAQYDQLFGPPSDIAG